MQDFNTTLVENAKAKDSHAVNSKLVLKMSNNSSDMESALTFPFKNLQRFVDDYREYRKTTLEPTQQRLEQVFADWRNPAHWRKLVDHTTAVVPLPVRRCRMRIKEPKAVVRKILAKPDPYSDGLSPASFIKMFDALGTRVIVHFLSDLPIIDREIRESGLFEISSSNTPHAYLPVAVYKKLGLKMDHEIKPSGYASIHYVLRLSKNVYPNGHRPWFELQLRTHTQDLWAEVEHLLGYKHATTSPEVHGQFQLIAQLLSTIDNSFDLLKIDLSKRQAKSLHRGDELLDTENLPGVLAERGLSCSQYDIKGLLKMASSCNIATIEDLRSVMTTENIKAVRRAGMESMGRGPVGGELIVSLLLLFGSHRDVNHDEVISNLVEYNRILNEL